MARSKILLPNFVSFKNNVFLNKKPNLHSRTIKVHPEGLLSKLRISISNPDPYPEFHNRDYRDRNPKERALFTIN